MTPISCPACHCCRTIRVADHYEAQVRLTETDPQAIAPFAPPLRRSILSGTLTITLLWMAILCPGFVPASRGLMVALSFGVAGIVALISWLRTRKSDRMRMAAYQQALVCLDCGHRFQPM